ncbi:terminase gpA endonuclease subunit [Oceanicella actignis]|uniref:Phage terminase, large subunit GpA n=1 Tax=Oceanicella actignis TaxID=1189325 RepID=A0A1M7U202_9RHOB|nr:terminase gpA endonuclease subunit [Oceanicella actignis]SES76437.1 Phage terminase, large subunit GpA [Oceanicella actignis]SHN76978.1 Phage terminase, large subunit GpA [Oceanicella actignis]
MLEPPRIEYRPGRPLPAYRPLSDAIRAALPALAPPARISVSEAATRRMVEAGGHWAPWRNDVAPYMVEPMDMVTSRRFEAVIFAGPARSSKTEALILNPLAHAILAAPRLVHVVHMTQSAAREFSVETIDKLLRNSPELAARLAKGKGANNTYDKRFSGGCRLTIGWPVVQQLSARSIPLVLLTDYDRFPTDLGGEGSAFALGRKRTQSAGTRGMIVAEASPGFPITDESWTPATRHEAPPCDGILGLYNAGTRARWYWPCPNCGVEFEPTFERIQFPKGGTPAERGAAAFMACLHCGGVIEPSAKAKLNAQGRWLHESPEGEPAPLDAGPRKASAVSYWLHGPAAAFATWAQLVTRYLEGVERFNATGDETALKSATNVDLGLPYLPRALGASAALSESALREAASDRPWKVAPAGTRFITAAVDVQAGRFVVQVEAWAEGLERTVIDRWDIVNPPEGAPRATERAIDPGRFGEDWAALRPLSGMSWPVAGADYRLTPCGVVIDAGGAPGVTPNAYAFFRRARREARGMFHLVRGRGGERVKRAEAARPETAHRGRAHVARDVTIIWAGTDRLKDEIAASLTRREAGARALLIPRGAPAEMFAEYAAERRGAKGWEKKPGVKRNESLDLSVYSLALAIVLGAEKIEWGRPPRWAAGDSSNTFATAAAPQTKERAGHGEGAPPPKTTAPKRRRGRRGPRNRFNGW